VLAGLYFKIERTEWLVMTLVAALVLSAEAMNTAVEFVVDLVSPDYHPLAGKAKDVAAAAVLLAAFGAIIVGLIIFLPKILNLF
jgi:diacylglycerol kinase